MRSLIVAVLFLLVPVVFAQETTVEQPQTSESQYAQTPVEAENLGPKNKEFMNTYAAFQAITKQLQELTIENQDAKPERQLEIDKLYHEKYAEGEKLVKQMTDTALDAFDEAPNRNPWLVNWVYSLVEWEYRRENYEVPVRIFKRLVAKEIANEAAPLYVFAGISAVMTMDIDDAEAWLKVAKENGFLDKYFESFHKNQKGMQEAMMLAGMLESIPTFKTDWAREQEIRKAETEAGEKDPAQKLPRVLLKTSKGDITLELFENEAPIAVANFVSLVEKGFYNGVVFHRVLPRFMAQGGDPTGTGRGGPGYTIDCECQKPDYRKHFRGSISMAHAGRNTGGSQFFLTFVPTSMLDGKHTVFGRVVDGFEVLADIQRVDPEDKDAMVPTIDKIVEATVLNKRDHAYEPKQNR
jgi:cyclophilin family peptidyl-prolyl cis-trans isomerase